MALSAEALLQRIHAQMQRNNGYQARVEIDGLLARLSGEPTRLEPFGFKVYSQNDEDGIVEEIFRRLAIPTGRFVEIGVQNGLECNSLYLIHKGWRGAWMEGDAAQRPAIEAKFGSIIGKRLTLAFGWITAENLNAVLKALRAGDDLDFLSIDIDGNDIYLLEALAIRPKVICIEYNAKFPGNIVKQQTYDPKRRWTGTDYSGSSLKAIAHAAARKGYRLVGTNITGTNAFFVREELAGDLFPADCSSEHLYNPARYWLWADHFLNIGHRADFGPYVDLIDE